MKAMQESVNLPSVSDLTATEHVRSLVGLCQQFIYEYYETGAPWSGRTWWIAFNEAGLQLREALETTQAQGNAHPLGDQEQEQAYLLLIQVAYFFEPAGLAEAFFLEQGWVQEQANADEVAPAKAGARRTLHLAAARCLQAIGGAIQHARRQNAHRSAQHAGPAMQPS